MKKKILLLIAHFSFIISQAQQPATWSKEKANEWYKKQGWIVGCNFLPSTAINQLEMWQAETFDTSTINRELGWAESIGFNTTRVFLHDLVWETDSTQFKKRINTFLSIASHHHIKPLFVFFDDCWNPNPKIGKQPEPKPGIHNSGWARSPAMAIHNDSTKWNYLEKYVKDILLSFKNDNRILMWDLYNEPGNSSYDLTSFPLLKKVFEWAWAVHPSQPLTCAIWYGNKTLTDFQLTNSDVITFHNYENVENLEKEINDLLKYGRPVVCSEYMARTRNSKFETHLPVFKKYDVGAINWGFVSGKSNTIYQWDTPVPDGSEPKIWFHDIFRRNGTAYDEKEISIIKQLTGTK